MDTGGRKGKGMKKEEERNEKKDGVKDKKVS